ncbi:MAG: hypothetical protein Q8R00_02325 [Candidatus Nanoarchaeia archaeon]|nr:hypothetical protein [Candidatus Nanoarchaeia archaeon]
MKTITLLFIVASVLLLVGCAAQRTSVERTTVPTAQPQDLAEEGFDGLTELEQEINLDELDSIEKDLELGL